MRLYPRSSAALLAAILVVCARGDGELSRVQVGKIGKAATALVECQLRSGKGHGSAFCVHPSGLFVTNEHVIRGATQIRLVLNPSLASQKLIQATVLRSDREKDLALLRAEGARDLPALPLGNTTGLEELQEVIAVGFPFGRALRVVRDEYPAVSINAGSITSLRRLKGELHRIQVDIALNPGNSGGAVLDRKGKVVGVVVAGVLGSGVNFVIPISHLTAFLQRPELEFTPPRVDRTAVGKLALFEARAVTLIPDGKPLNMELILKAEGGKERRFRMALEGGSYRARAVPVPPPDGPQPLRATVSYADGSVTGTVLDKPVKVAGKELKLSEIRSIRLSPTPAVERADGKKVEGAVAGLTPLEVRLGKETVRLNLTSASVLQLEAPAVAAVNCVVVARQNDREVGRTSGSITFPEDVRPDVAVVTPGTPPTQAAKVTAAKLDADKVTRALPAPAEDAVLGGGGRYLILHLPKLRRLAVFDVGAVKMAGYIPLGSDNVKFAAGMTKLFVVLGDEGILQRWDLASRTREVAAPLPVREKLFAVAMGHASEGPLLVAAAHARFSNQVLFLDARTLNPLDLKRTERHQFGIGENMPVRASADGKVFGTFHPNLSPQSIFCMAVEGNQIKYGGNGDSSGHVTPGPDGSTLYTGRGLYTAQGKPLGKVGREGLYSLPAATGLYHIGMRINGEGAANKHRAAVYLGSDTRPLVALKDIDWPLDMNEWDREKFAFDRRIHFIPDAGVLITIPSTNDKLVLHRLDVDAALEKSGIDYLFVTSRPPAGVAKGQVLRYPITVKSRRGGVSYKLDSGPKGMEVTSTGEVRWRVPADFAEKEVDVIISVGDKSGQEVFHTFKLAVGP